MGQILIELIKQKNFTLFFIIAVFFACSTIIYLYIRSFLPVYIKKKTEETEEKIKIIKSFLQDNKVDESLKEILKKEFYCLLFEKIMKVNVSLDKIDIILDNLDFCYKNDISIYTLAVASPYLKLKDGKLNINFTNTEKFRYYFTITYSIMLCLLGFSILFILMMVQGLEWSYFLFLLAFASIIIFVSVISLKSVKDIRAAKEIAKILSNKKE